MRYDLAPLYRSTVGFDQLFRLLDHTLKVDENLPSYPPYNIEKKSENEYRISMAVAGIAEKDLNVVAEGNSLAVTGRKEEKEAGEEANWLHRGIASRAFERRFQLADHIRVEGASLKDGLLHIELKRDVPEAAKPRQIAIGTK